MNTMSYAQIKRLILFLPTVVVGLWEYVRHQLLMPVLSMEAGNWLTPVLVFLVSITLLRRLFAMLERTRRELEEARTVKANLEAREELARELHDGIAQSLFLLSVKLDRMESGMEENGMREQLGAVRRTVREVDRYVRQALANLKRPAAGIAAPAGAGRAGMPPGRADKARGIGADSGGSAAEPAARRGFAAGTAAEESMAARVGRLAGEAMIDVNVDWSLEDGALGSREKAELLACVREAVINVRKHAHAEVTGRGGADGWTVEIADDGRGFDADPLAAPGRYGLKIMADRAADMGWSFGLESKPGRTVVRIGKQPSGRGENGASAEAKSGREAAAQGGEER
ncbi:histidine kinase [Saccharibacillus sp. CPCC 101409]|uniref:sensor histidine kinase n=1 Tax=Saccharibacillus sp. CPCC 101409 TaxID=3058041 RepID=UPI002673753F|nr:histidine kinase [Saccharibacillus sp. CPCC 101409]MDO3411764.1 histidine kinase [Saccharibacillus sp. CPCC 101409]